MNYNQIEGQRSLLFLKYNEFKGLKNQQDSPAGLPGGLVLVRNILTTSEEQTSKSKIAKKIYGDLRTPWGSANSLRNLHFADPVRVRKSAT